LLITEHVHPGPGVRILDLGCGTAELLDHLPATSDYVGVDVSHAYIKQARERFGSRGEFRVGDATSIDDDLRDFDIVLAFGVLHHLDDAQARRLLDRAARALKPGGRAVTVDPVFTPEMSPIARYVIAHDRGQHVRGPDAYRALCDGTPFDVSVRVRTDVLRIPYAHCVMDCALGRPAD
jgi:SAM-dependent methyltransferase